MSINLKNVEFLKRDSDNIINFHMISGAVVCIKYSDNNEREAEYRRLCKIMNDQNPYLNNYKW